MSLASNVQDVAFYSGWDIDKIVNVFEGSYNKATQTTARTDAFLGTVYTYAIPHGFNRPVFPEILWSENGTTWADGGSRLTASGNDCIAISDSTNIYIVTTSNSGTQYYKVIATWITDFDNTNPLVDEFHAPNNPFLFDGRVNYQKIHSQGVTTYPAGTFGSQTTIQINHNLGYRPNFRVFFEPFSGEVWPLVAGGNSNPLVWSEVQDEATAIMTTTSLNVTVSRHSNAIRRIWYKIYYDQN